MKRILTILFVLLLLGWLATGFYVVRGNEKAVVRRCGKVLRDSGGNVAMRSSGLHYDLPWPFLQVDRVNLSEVHTISVGTSELEFSDSQFMQVVDPSAESRYLTGDKNILNVRFGIQYRIAEEQIDAFLFGSHAPTRELPAIKNAAEALLQALAVGVLSDLVTRCGVDFVHTHGRAAIQQQMTDRIREQVLRRRLGVRVDTVTLDVVEPPLRVRAAFLDVNDARADREKRINAANAYAAERAATAEADAQQVRNEAEVFRRQRVEQARAEADRFKTLIAQFRIEGQPATAQQSMRRRIALQRLYIEAMEEVLRRVKSKVVLQSGKPVDLTIPRDPKR